MTNSVFVPVKQLLIPFFSSHILAVLLPDGRIAASLSSLCKMLKLAKHGQMERIRRNKELAESLLIILVETPKGPQLLEALVAEAIRPWVMGIQINLIAPEKRPLVSALKEQAYETLSRALLQRETGEAAESAPELQAVPPPRVVADEPDEAPSSPWERLFATLHVSQEALHETQQALRDIWQEEQAKAEQQARAQRALGARIVTVEEWLMSLDRRVAKVSQSSASEPEPQPALSEVHRVDLRTLFRLLEQATKCTQAQLEHELIDTFRVSAINAIPDEQWQDVLAWCIWRAQQIQ